MKLWYFNSSFLGGFYRSEVYVVAPDRDEAVKSAVIGFINHVDESITDLLLCFLDSGTLDPTDDDYHQKRAAAVEAFRAEATMKIKEITSGVRIDVAS